MVQWYIGKSQKETNRNLDFFDDIEMATKALKNTKNYDEEDLHLFVDEFQDINQPQWELICAHNYASLSVIGDPRQSIFSFQGSDNQIINDSNWCDHKIELTQTFRFQTSTAVKLLNSIISTSNIPDKECLKDMKSFEEENLTKDSFHSKKEFDSLEEKNQWILNKCHDVRNQSQLTKQGGESLTILICHRSAACSGLQNLLTNDGCFKVPHKDLNQGNQSHDSHNNRQINKIFLALLLINAKNLHDLYNEYPNAKEDFEKIVLWLSSSSFRQCDEEKHGNLTDKERDNLWKSFRSAKTTDSFLNFVMTYPKNSREYLTFLPFNQHGVKWLQNWESSQQYVWPFTVENLTALYNQLIWNCSFWTTSVDGNNEWFRRIIVSKYSQITKRSALLNFLSKTTTKTEVDYGDFTIRMKSAHQVKGKEFDFVVIDTFEEGVWPPQYSIQHSSQDEDPEEWRVLYVACSRAKKHVFFTTRVNKMSRLGVDLFHNQDF